MGLTICAAALAICIILLVISVFLYISSVIEMIRLERENTRLRRMLREQDILGNDYMDACSAMVREACRYGFRGQEESDGD